MTADARSARLDSALRQFLNANYPQDSRQWLINRAAWGMVSPLDLKAIREAYREVGNAAHH